jgi:CheY-like chemotaxis protein
VDPAASRGAAQPLRPIRRATSNAERDAGSQRAKQEHQRRAAAPCELREPSAVERTAKAVAQLASRVGALAPNITALATAIDAFATAYSEKGSIVEKRARVLVIDDDEALGNMMRRVLASEHEVVVLTSAADALGLLGQGERFDLILCDLMLPGVTGADFYEHVDMIAQTPTRSRIVFITGGAYTDGSRVFLEQIGAPCIDKPFSSVAALRAAVRERLRVLNAQESSNDHPPRGRT